MTRDALIIAAIVLAAWVAYFFLLDLLQLR